MYGLYFLPEEINPKNPKKYPTILKIYAGPRAQVIHTFLFSFFPLSVLFNK